MSELHLRPGLRLGSYPQKKNTDLSELEQQVARFFKRLKSRFSRKIPDVQMLTHKVNELQAPLQKMSDHLFDESIQQLREQLYRQGLEEVLILTAFAHIREAAARTLGMSHYDVQLFGGWLMINGILAEMETGEGKTLTMTLPACTAAMAGIPVHVITANDYLAARDCEIMQPLYQRLGLSAASITDGAEQETRQRGYQSDIVHTTNKQIVFDYLRDRIEMGRDIGPQRFEWKQHQRQRSSQSSLLLRGLCFALVDEADSVLIDEAKTPLIISRTLPNDESNETYSDALYLASTLFQDQDYRIDSRARQVELTERATSKLVELVQNLPALWRHKRKRERLVTLALNATHFYQKDKQYIVEGGKVVIIDESTGRLMPDRSWEQGLHQMIEAKEGCIISEQREPLARISYQRFFSRYLRLAGTSGTLSEVSAELRQVYDLDVVKVPTRSPSRRHMMAEKLFCNEDEKQQAFIARVQEVYQQGRPLLVGTCSVAESEQVSTWLQQRDIPHQVLNARQDKHEAEIISQAGQSATITVATNMAGRGTDIALASGVAEQGGLHVLALCRNASHRVDRQLYGRCARQGDPGSAEAILSLQDPLLMQYYSSAMLRFIARLASDQAPVNAWLSKLILYLPQKKHEKEQRRMRSQLMKEDKRLRRVLAFSGRFE